MTPNRRSRVFRRVAEVTLLAAVAAVLVAVFALPEGLRRDLVFRYADPSVRTALAAHFVHLGTGHFLTNLASYVLLVGVGYPLAVRAGQRRLFVGALVTFLTAFPLALSVLNLAVPRDAVTFGFSAINMALVGLLPLLLVLYARRHIDSSLRVDHALGLFFASLSLIGLIAVPVSGLTLGVAAFALVPSVVYTGCLLGVRRSESCAAARRELGRLVTTDALFAVGLVLFVAFLYVGFPSPTTDDGQVVNLYSHFLGYSLSFIVAYLAHRLGLFDADDTLAGPEATTADPTAP